MISGADTFGKSAGAAILRFVAGIAQQFGQLFILLGSGLLIIGHPGGGALIRYGIALLAFAGGLRGIAGRSEKNHKGASQQQQTTGSTGGSAATSSTGGQPSVLQLPVATSGKGGNTIINLDAGETRGFMSNLFERNQVITADNMGRKLRSKVQPIVKS